MTNQTLSFLYTIEQKRAKKACELAEGDKDYKSLAEKFPPMISTCGLLQALSFFSTKSDKSHHLYTHLSVWFQEAGLFSGPDLLSYITRCSVSEYRRATIEALAFLTWLKRFAVAKYEEAERQAVKPGDEEEKTKENEPET